MADFVHNYYLYIKALHVIAIISWMAGLLYLPRLFVYHATVSGHHIQEFIFIQMERKLLYIITIPASIISLITGDLMAWYIYALQGGWLHIKLVATTLLFVYMIFLYISYKRFSRCKNKISPSSWRKLNEIPTILMVIIVICVVVKPF